jgi:cob(I)alamin adenosyltransferase
MGQALLKSKPPPRLFGILPRLAKIYTRTGDGGETGVIGGGRLPKDDQLLEAYGTVDELNAILGLARTEPLPKELEKLFSNLQNELFSVGADLASPWQDREPSKTQSVIRISPSHWERLEKEIDLAETTLSELRQFILPGGSRVSALLHQARTVCRRAERRVVALVRQDRANPEIRIYLNRLSDWLFVMARFANHKAGHTDTIWTPPAMHKP